MNRDVTLSSGRFIFEPVVLHLGSAYRVDVRLAGWKVISIRRV
jgi:hypothetical protein